MMPRRSVTPRRRHARVVDPRRRPKSSSLPHRVDVRPTTGDVMDAWSRARAWFGEVTEVGRARAVPEGVELELLKTELTAGKSRSDSRQ